MTSFHTDLDRPPLREEALERELVRPGELWRRVEVLPEVASTNTVLAARASEGALEGTVLVTEHQTRGRGRLGRGFEVPPRAALTFSVLVRPDVPAAHMGWLPLLMGVATVREVQRVAGLTTVLKWPNDVMAAGPAGVGPRRKLAGILAEAAPSALEAGIVVGMGLNVAQGSAELPVDTATSLALERAATDREALLRAVLRGFAELYRDWHRHGGDAAASDLATEYRTRCDTIGRSVRVELPDGRTLQGEATGVDPSGRLTVRAGDGTVESLSAGDVVHVR